MMCRTVVVTILIACFLMATSTAQPFSKRALLGCLNNKCSMLVEALRDPRRIDWKADRMDKAWAHMKAYDQLFGNNDDDDNHFRRSARQQRLRARNPQYVRAVPVNVGL